MLRYIKCDGTWRFNILLGFQSTVISELGKLGVMLVLPPSPNTEVISVKGAMSTGGKNHLGERECHHLHADGDLAYVGGTNVSSNVVRPFPDDPSFSIQQTTYKYRSSGLKVGTFCGPTFYGTLGSYRVVFPARTINGTQYRDISYEVSCLGGNQWYAVFRYSRLRNGSWVVETSDSTIELDTANYRYRYKSGSGWQRWITFDSFYYSTVGSGIRTITSPKDLSGLSAHLSSLFVDRDFDYLGDLSVRCADDARSIDMNSLEYLRDLGSVVSDAKSVYSLLKGKVSLKAISKLYLSYKYGIRLTAKDTVDLGHDLAFLTRKPRSDVSIARAAESCVQQTGVISRYTIYHSKIYYRTHSDGFLKGVSDLQSVGLFPSPKTVWELIPFSFVVDWFKNISGGLSQYDADLTWSTHHIVGTTISWKRTYLGIPPVYFGLEGYSGSVSFTEYTRHTPDTCIRPKYFTDTPRQFNNFVELAALILANKR